MKITNVTPLVMGTAWRNLTFVKVETDEGLVGLGEARDAEAMREVPDMAGIARGKILADNIVTWAINEAGQVVGFSEIAALIIVSQARASGAGRVGSDRNFRTVRPTNPNPMNAPATERTIRFATSTGGASNPFVW
mgnify:CR=1 FL=1